MKNSIMKIAFEWLYGLALVAGGARVIGNLNLNESGWRMAGIKAISLRKSMAKVKAKRTLSLSG